MATLSDEMMRVVEEQRLGFVATVCPDGTPNLSPKGTVSVWDPDHLAFADICSPRTVANLRGRAVMEINVVDPIRRKGYRFKGSGRVVDRGPDYEAGVEFFRRRGVANPIRSVVFVRVDRAEALISPVYDTGATETEVVERWLKRTMDRFQSAGTRNNTGSDST
jgi:predicted pyridoxine 5'-phosphate oxidase superfamily flavin-nucleotide-binding protein